jgi:hypothetical protein
MKQFSDAEKKKVAGKCFSRLKARKRTITELINAAHAANNDPIAATLG